MIVLTSLWLPIVLSAVLVFVASSLIHTVLGYHNNDNGQLPDENATLAALRALKIPDGDYGVPYGGSSAARKSPDFHEKMKAGPLALLTVKAKGNFGMGPTLLTWYIYNLIVSTFVAYLASRTLAAGADYLSVFRVAAFTAFMAYGMGAPIQSIWFWRKWSTTIKNLFDGLVYGLLTGGVFGWLWPHVAAG
jgi:hypothetical protein